MKVEQTNDVQMNRFMKAFRSETSFVRRYFEYEWTDQSFHDRARYLSERTYDRETLAETIRNYMKPYGWSEAIERHIESLRNDAYVVVGGQQAGIAGGPLLSLHKALTVLLEAKKQSAQLSHPVVPLFWIAGEDHDLEEINHTYVKRKGRVQKMVYEETTALKVSASQFVYTKEEMERYVKQLFQTFPETEHTKSLVQEALSHVKEGETYTDLFTRVMMSWTKEHGLLFIDAADEAFRQMEKEAFVQMIDRNEQMSKRVVATERAFAKEGYGTPLEAIEESAHLFYVHETGRLLLKREGDRFYYEPLQLEWTADELKQLARTTPERLSNDVVTRPLMQEMMLPVLAFVGGNGELAYWSLLKGAFQSLDLQMPIVMPRISTTLVTRPVEYALRETGMTANEALTANVSDEEQRLLRQYEDETFVREIRTLEQLMEQQYERIRQAAPESLARVVEKNEERQRKELAFLHRSNEKMLKERYDVIFRRLNEWATDLQPNGHLQERTFSSYQYFNMYGPTLLDDLLNIHYDESSAHHIVYC